MYQDYNNFYQDINYLLDDRNFTQFASVKPEQLDQSNDLLLSSSFYPDNNIGFAPYYDYTATSPNSSTHGSSCSSSPNIENIYDYFLDIPMPLLPQAPTVPSDRPTKKQPRPNKTFACPICKRLFARKHDLQRHIRVHTGDKPYSCINCNKSFARTDALKRHLRMEDTCRTSPVIQALKNTGSRRYRNL